MADSQEEIIGPETCDLGSCSDDESVPSLHQLLDQVESMVDKMDHEIGELLGKDSLPRRKKHKPSILVHRADVDLDTNEEELIAECHRLGFSTTGTTKRQNILHIQSILRCDICLCRDTHELLLACQRCKRPLHAKCIHLQVCSSHPCCLVSALAQHVTDFSKYDMICPMCSSTGQAQLVVDCEEGGRKQTECEVGHPQPSTLEKDVSNPLLESALKVFYHFHCPSKLVHLARFMDRIHKEGLEAFNAKLHAKYGKQLNLTPLAPYVDWSLNDSAQELAAECVRLGFSVATKRQNLLRIQSFPMCVMCCRRIPGAPVLQCTICDFFFHPLTCMYLPLCSMMTNHGSTCRIIPESSQHVSNWKDWQITCPSCNSSPAYVFISRIKAKPSWTPATVRATATAVEKTSNRDEANADDDSDDDDDDGTQASLNSNLQPSSDVKVTLASSNLTKKWSAEEENVLLRAVSAGLPWNEILRLHFPSRSLSVCRRKLLSLTKGQPPSVLSPQQPKVPMEGRNCQVLKTWVAYAMAMLRLEKRGISLPIPTSEVCLDTGEGKCEGCGWTAHGERCEPGWLTTATPLCGICAALKAESEIMSQEGQDARQVGGRLVTRWFMLSRGKGLHARERAARAWTDWLLGLRFESERMSQIILGMVSEVHFRVKRGMLDTEVHGLDHTCVVVRVVCELVRNGGREMLSLVSLALDELAAGLQTDGHEWLALQLHQALGK